MKSGPDIASDGDDGLDRKAEQCASNPFAPVPATLVVAILLASVFSLGVENASATRPAWLTDTQNMLFFAMIGVVIWIFVADRRLTPALRTRIRELREQKERGPKVAKRRYKQLLLAAAAFAAAWLLGWVVGHA